MANPFSVRWLAGWTFQTVLMEGEVQVEGHGLSMCLRTPVLPGESPVTAADRVVLAEVRRRRALHSTWLRGQMLPAPMKIPELSGAMAETELRVVQEADLQPLIRLLA